jgi:hypothetical protein
MYLPRLYPCALVVKKSAGLQIFVVRSTPRRAENHGWFSAKNLQDCRFLSCEARPEGRKTMNGLLQKINPKISDTIALCPLQTLYPKYYYLLYFTYPLKIR